MIEQAISRASAVAYDGYDLRWTASLVIALVALAITEYWSMPILDQSQSL